MYFRLERWRQVIFCVQSSLLSVLCYRWFKFNTGVENWRVLKHLIHAAMHNSAGDGS